MIDLTQATESWQLASRRTTTAATCAYDLMPKLLDECNRLTAENEACRECIRQCMEAFDVTPGESDDLALPRLVRELIADYEKLNPQPEPERAIWWPEPDEDGDYLWPDRSIVWANCVDMYSAATPICDKTPSRSDFPTREAAAAWLFSQKCGPWHPRPNVTVRPEPKDEVSDE